MFDHYVPRDNYFIVGSAVVAIPASSIYIVEVYSPSQEVMMCTEVLALSHALTLQIVLVI